MTTTAKKSKRKTVEEIDYRTKIKPRGLAGLYKGLITINGTDEEVFQLNRLAKVQQ